MSIFAQWFPALGDAGARAQAEQAMAGLEDFLLPDGCELLFEGEINSDVMFYIVSGNIRVTVGGEHDAEVLLNTLGPGDFVGEMGFLQGEERCASLRAAGDTTLKIIGRESLPAILAGASPILLLILDQLINRLRAMAQRGDDAGAVPGV